MSDVLIIGNGGHARACVDALSPSSELTPVGYVGPQPGDVLGLPYLGDDEQLSALAAGGLARAFVALGDNVVRAAVTRRCIDARLDVVSIVASTSRISPTSSIGAGSVVLHGAVVGANARIGRGTIINTGATVDHDCVIGDFVHIAPGVHLAGTVSVDDGAMVGVGASVVPGIRIGARSIVGAGAVVIHDVAEGQTVVGVPAQELKP